MTRVSNSQCRSPALGTKKENNITKITNRQVRTVSSSFRKGGHSSLDINCLLKVKTAVKPTSTHTRNRANTELLYLLKRILMFNNFENH